MHPSKPKRSKSTLHPIRPIKQNHIITTQTSFMSMQSRRKQRSADQLLSRTGHAIPLTTPSSRKPPIPTPKQQQTQPTQQPSHSQQQQSQQPRYQSQQQSQQQSHQQSQQQRYQSPQQSQQQHSQQPHQQRPPTYSSQPTPIPTPSSRPSQHMKGNKQFQKRPQIESVADIENDLLYDSLFHGNDENPESNAFNGFLSGDASSNPFLSQSGFTGKSFQQKLHDSMTTNTPKPTSSSSPTSTSSRTRPIPSSQPNVKATSIFASKPTIPIDTNDLTDPNAHDLDFNPLSALREEFNTTSTTKYKNPMDLTHLQLQEQQQQQQRLSKQRQQQQQQQQQELDTDNEGYLTDNEEHAHQPQLTRTTTPTTTKPKKSTTTPKPLNNDDLSDLESDPEGYMELLRERERDDADFQQELDAYYKQYPHHRKLVQNMKTVQNLEQKQHKGNQIDGFDIDSDELAEDDFSSLGNSLRGDDSFDFTPDAFQNNRKNKKNKQHTQSELDSIAEGDEDGLDEDDNNDDNDNKPTKRRQVKFSDGTNTIEVDGLRIPLRGISRQQVEEFLKENDENKSEDVQEDQEELEHMQSLGFTPEDLEADRPKRIDYYKLPTPDQIPLIDTSQLTFQDTKSVLNWDVPWPEHTSTCDLSVRTCILGTPNAGKSVVVNNLTRTRVTAVSAKRNTTRRRVLGIATEGNAQLTLYDTPGINEIHDAKKFQRDLATEAWDAVADADLALVVLDAAKRIGGPELFLLHKCSDVKTSAPHIKWVLVLNKVDLVDPKDKLLDMLFRVQTLMPFDECFMVSGLDGDGMADMEHYLYQQAIPREWEHERDEKTDQSDVQLAAELIRETLYHRLNKEIPYTVQQENVEWLPLKNGQLRIDQRLIVRREQHKRILVGSHGAALKNITKSAEQRLSVAFRRPISLNLRVSVSVTQDFDV